MKLLGAAWIMSTPDDVSRYQASQDTTYAKRVREAERDAALRERESLLLGLSFKSCPTHKGRPMGCVGAVRALIAAHLNKLSDKARYRLCLQ